MEEVSVMARKGQLKTPVVPLREAHEKAMALIDGYEDGCAIFMIAGNVHATRRTSQSFKNNLRALASNLVGVYDTGIDSRYVMEDLRTFYMEAAV